MRSTSDDPDPVEGLPAGRADDNPVGGEGGEQPSGTTRGTGQHATFLDGLRLGGGTFTRLPMTPPRAVNASSGRIAMLSAPVWGVVLGLIAGGLAGAQWWWFTRDDPGALAALLSAAVVLAALAWLTRGLHLDGLADTFDGFASMRRGADALAIMRDPNIGALGAAGLVLVLLIQLISLALLLTKTSPWGFVLVVTAICVVSRGILPWMIRAGTPGSNTGLGVVVVGSVPTAAAIAATALSALAAAALLVAAGLGVVAAVLAMLAAIAASLILRRSALRRFGVLTGDVLGAAVETSATCALLVAATFA